MKESNSWTGRRYGDLSGQSRFRCFAFSGFAIRLPVGKSFSDDPLHGARTPFYVVNPELDPVIVPEIEFSEVTVQVPFAAMLVSTAHPSFEHGEEAFCGVHVRLSAYPFFFAVIDSFMAASELITDVPIGWAFVGH